MLYKTFTFLVCFSENMNLTWKLLSFLNCFNILLKSNVDWLIPVICFCSCVGLTLVFRHYCFIWVQIYLYPNRSSTGIDDAMISDLTIEIQYLLKLVHSSSNHVHSCFKESIDLQRMMQLFHLAGKQKSCEHMYRKFIEHDFKTSWLSGFDLKGNIFCRIIFIMFMHSLKFLIL